MAIIYTYPIKTTSANRDDLILISDSADKNKTKQISVAKLPGGIDFVGVGGNGTAGKIPKWSTQYDLTDSSISEDSVTGNIGIGIQPNGFALATLDVSKNGLDTNQPIIRITQRRDNTSWPVAEMGRFEFFSSDGSGNSPYSLGYVGISNDYVGQTLPSGAMTFATTPYNATGGSEAAIERMRISSIGNVGIGTAIPDSILTVKADAADVGLPVIKASVDTFGNGYTLIGDNYIAGESQINLGVSFSGSNGVLSRGVKVSNTANNTFLSSQDQYTTYSNAFVLHGDGSLRFLNTSTSATTPVGTAVSLSERMRINSNGFVGIGTTVPNAKLHTSNSIDGTNGTSQIRISANSSTLNYAYFGMIDETFNTAKLKLGTTFGYGTQVDAMTIYNGNVGIGTTSPTTKLDVRGVLSFPFISTVTGTTVVKFSESNDDEFLLKANLNGTGSTGNSMSFGSGISGWASNIMTWRGDGNVGIGTTAPAAKLDILDTINQTAIRVTNNQYNNYLIQKRRTDDTQILGIKEFGSIGGLALVTGSSERLNISNLGNVGIGTTTPSQKLTVSGKGLFVTGGSTPDSTIATYEKGITLTSGGAGNQRLVIDVSNVTNGGSYIQTRHESTSFPAAEYDLALNPLGGNVGIGTSSPASKLAVDGGDIEVDDSASGLILRSPNGVRHRVKVANDGTLTVTTV